MKKEREASTRIQLAWRTFKAHESFRLLRMRVKLMRLAEEVTAARFQWVWRLYLRRSFLRRRQNLVLRRFTHGKARHKSHGKQLLHSLKAVKTGLRVGRVGRNAYHRLIAARKIQRFIRGTWAFRRFVWAVRRVTWSNATVKVRFGVLCIPSTIDRNHVRSGYTKLLFVFKRCIIADFSSSCVPLDSSRNCIVAILQGS